MIDTTSISFNAYNDSDYIMYTDGKKVILIINKHEVFLHISLLNYRFLFKKDVHKSTTHILGKGKKSQRPLNYW